MQEEAADKENTGGDDLDGHGHAPAGSRGDVHVLVDAIVDPEADEGTDLVGDFEETGQDTTDGDDGKLGDVAGDGGGDGAAGDSGQGTSSVCDG